MVSYHSHHFDESDLGGKEMLANVDRLPSTDVFTDLLSCDVPRASRAVRTIRQHHLTMSTPSSQLVDDMVCILRLESMNALETQALLELRDRLGVNAHTSARQLARLSSRIAAADCSLKALNGRKPPWLDLKETAFMLIALKHLTNHPRLGPRLLGWTPPRRVASADMARLAAVLFSGVGAVTLVVRSAIVLGAMATSRLNDSLKNDRSSDNGPSRGVVSANAVRFSVVFLTAAGAITLVTRSGVMFGSTAAAPLLMVNNVQ